MRWLFAGALALLGCTEQSAPKPAEQNAPRPERTMTDRAKVALEKLSDSEKSEQQRIEAARELASLGDPAAVVPMMLVAQTELPDALAQEIRTALEKIGASRVLIEDLRQADDAGRARAADLLGRLGDRTAIDPLIRALSDPAAKVRESAAGSLGALGAKQAEASLVERLRKDAAPDVRGAAAQALGLVGTESAKSALKEALSAEKDDFVKVLIEQALR